MGLSQLLFLFSSSVCKDLFHVITCFSSRVQVQQEGLIQYCHLSLISNDFHAICFSFFFYYFKEKKCSPCFSCMLFLVYWQLIWEATLGGWLQKWLFPALGHLCDRMCQSKQQVTFYSMFSRLPLKDARLHQKVSRQDSFRTGQL